MDERKVRRVAANQARFREMNEVARTGIDAFDGDADTYSVMCECAIEDCDEQFDIPKDAYEHVRPDPTWFVVLPEHVVPDAEEVVERFEQYWILRAIGDGKRVAAETYNASDGPA